MTHLKKMSERIEQDQAGGDPPVEQRGGRRQVRLAVLASSCLYLLLVTGVWGTMHWAGERWWLATALLFGPRWVWAAPLAGLIPAAILWHRRSLWVLAAAMIVVVVPVMGFSVPWRQLRSAPPAQIRVRVLTCNIHNQKNGERLRKLIEETRPDIVAIQEPTSAIEQGFEKGQWKVRQGPGLLVAVRLPYDVSFLRTLIPKDSARISDGVASTVRINTPQGPIEFISLHLASPHAALDKVREWDAKAAAMMQQNSSIRWQTSRSLRKYIDGLNMPTLIAGDFNLNVESPIYRECWSSLCDAFTDAGFGFGYTYRIHTTQTRIDHIMGASGWRATRCWVGPDVGSPHRPVIADMEWSGHEGKR